MITKKGNQIYFQGKPIGSLVDGCLVTPEECGRAKVAADAWIATLAPKEVFSARGNRLLQRRSLFDFILDKYGLASQPRVQ